MTVAIDDVKRGRADTIFALSSGHPPAAIAIVRVSGGEAGNAVKALAGRLPRPRHASLATLRHPASLEELDRALVLWFPGPASATGEDLAEFHLHGGRSVVAGLLGALGTLEGLRTAEPGEFTRRAFENGRIDLAEAEGLSDLLQAETQSQRRAALALAGGALSRQVADWQRRLLALSAQLEAALDFADEDDVEEELPAQWSQALTALAKDIRAMLARPAAERLRDGIRVVIAGPPNAGKSSLLNSLTGRDAAITSSVPGTTRDLVEAPTAISGLPFILIDTAGLRESSDEVEGIGIDRARKSLAAADLILWLGEPGAAPERERTISVHAKADIIPEPECGDVDVSVSSVTGAGLNALTAILAARATSLLPSEGEVSLNSRHRDLLETGLEHMGAAAEASDILIAAEELRQARMSLDRITGSAGVEQMLDALFGSLCIGK